MTDVGRAELTQTERREHRASGRVCGLRIGSRGRREEQPLPEAVARVTIRSSDDILERGMAGEEPRRLERSRDPAGCDRMRRQPVDALSCDGDGARRCNGSAGEDIYRRGLTRPLRADESYDLVR